VTVLKYGKPIWQVVADAADKLETEEFTASDIVKKVHETNPVVPEISIKSYVTAMAPNHYFSGHWPSIRKNHPYFYFLGNGKFRLLKPQRKRQIDFLLAYHNLSAAIFTQVRSPDAHAVEKIS
jgi:hypothetical protein